MAKSTKNRRRLRSTPHPLSQPFRWNSKEASNSKRRVASEKKHYEETTCSVCMEFPHNAVLLLCSSHDNGCRPYMCGTGRRHSNCLQQFKNSRPKLICTESDSSGENPRRWPPIRSPKSPELSCPLCRGPVKGWTVVESARRHLNGKERSCMQDDCSFTGTYRELKKHVKSEHTCAKKPREVDPAMEERWRALELEIERRDVVSTVMSSVPRSVVFGDYVIEMVDGGDGEDEGAGAGEDGLVLGRNVLYVLREGARLMRRQWDDAVRESGGLDVAGNGVDGVAGVDGAASGSRGGWAAIGDRRRRRRSREGHLRSV